MSVSAAGRHPELPRICVALSGDHMAERAAQLLPQQTFFEFRLDTAANPEAALDALAELLRRHPHLATIATCRRKANGGDFAGSAEVELDLLARAAAVGARVVDLSLETAEELGIEAMDRLKRGPAALLISWHDFAGTPDLDAVHVRIACFAPDLLKIVPTATSLTDALRLLTFLQDHAPERNVVAMAMGTAGVLTRVLGPAHGSVFTFAAPDAASATAPGQVDLHTLRGSYRCEAISPATEVYGVFGSPITSSKSPAMLNAAFAAAGVDAVYLPLETASAGELFDAVEALKLNGASVTMPLKEQILPRLGDRLSPLAATLGAANTLLRTPAGEIDGDNTDAAGITDPLSEHVSLNGAKVLVLGAGGAARAAVFALRAKGAQVSILNRSAKRAEALAAAAGAVAVTRDQAAATVFDAIVNATPHGMRGQEVEAPLTAEEMQTKVFFDLVYNPLETPLLQAARARGIDVIPGIEMFLAQGAAQFTLWTGLPAPRDVLRQAVVRALESL